ncbi:hypothetical protein RUND412_006403 [Rhizina undulata]
METEQQQGQAPINLEAIKRECEEYQRQNNILRKQLEIDKEYRVKCELIEAQIAEMRRSNDEIEASTKFLREESDNHLNGLRQRLEDTNRRKKLVRKEVQDLRKETEELDAENVYLKKTLEELMKAEEDAKNVQQKASEQKQKNVSQTKEKLRNGDVVKPAGIVAEKRILKGRTDANIHHTKNVGAIHNSGVVSTDIQHIKKPGGEDGLTTIIKLTEWEEAETRESERHGEASSTPFSENPSFALSLHGGLLSGNAETAINHPRGVYFKVPSTMYLHDVPKYIRGGALEHIFLRENPSFRDLQDCVVIFQTASARQSFLLFAENRGGVSIGNALHPVFPLRWEEEVLEPKITDNFKRNKTRVLEIYDYPERISNFQVVKDLQCDWSGKRVRVAGAEKIDVHEGRDVVITCDSVERAKANLRHLRRDGRSVYSHLRIEHGLDECHGSVDDLLRI